MVLTSAYQNFVCMMAGDPVLLMDLRYQAICQVASALTYLHEEAEHKVIHRDVKARCVNFSMLHFHLSLNCFSRTTDASCSQPTSLEFTSLGRR
jgi:hypothetical protein